jgi:L-threonylcarbamoyladenylate synthase
MAEVMPTHTPALFNAAVARAVDLLRAGELVGLPTETVYGLGANALDPRAVARIFAVKGRPTHNPIIVHVASIQMAKRCVTHWPATANKLAAAFWPGPLTLVLPGAQAIPPIVTAGGPTVGVRWPNHPFIQAVISRCGFPLAVPSANPFSQVSPTTAEHVRKSLGYRIRLVVDGGPTQVGIESTVVDLSESVPRLLRPGMIHAESLQAVVGALKSEAGSLPTGAPGELPLRSPGLMKRHYSPKTRLIIRRWQDPSDLKCQIANLKINPRHVHVLVHTRIPLNVKLGRLCVMPHDPAAFARALYAELHRCDEAGAQLIIVEA